jgi:hypothetical protein
MRAGNRRAPLSPQDGARSRRRLPPRAPAAGPGHAEAHQVAQTVTRVIMQPAIPQVTLPRRDGLAQLVVPRLSMPPVIPAPQPRAPGRHLRISGDDRGRLRPVTHQI